MIGSQFDSVLVAAREGEHWALGELYHEYHPRLLRYIQSRLSWDAEDLAHEVWLDVGGGLRRFTGDESAFTAWIFTIARRRVVDQMRKAARRRTTSVAVEELHDRPSNEDVETEVLGSLELEELVRRIQELPGDQADVVLMRVVGGLDVDEVARVLGKRPGTVRVIAHRALKRLARDLPDVVGATRPVETAPEPVTAEKTERFKERDATRKS